MPQIRNLAIIFLVLGVIMAEFLPNINPATNLTAYSLNNALPNQSEILLNFLDVVEKETNSTASTQITTASLDNLNTIPINLSELVSDINTVLSPTLPSITPDLDYNLEPINYPINPPASLVPNQPNFNPVPVSTMDKSFIKDIIPPSDTDLFEAYATGGRAWYEDGAKVVVKWPDKEIFKSFDKTTGQEIDWLRDRLSYEPLDSPNALSNYINNYHGEIVAETKTWALVLFPSGGFIKIAKPVFSTIPFLTQE